MSTAKNLITLKNINVEEVHEKYNIPFDQTKQPVTEHKTLVEDLIFKKNAISFFDESMLRHSYNISIPTDTNKSTPYFCFWDRNKIPPNIIPIGCPISYRSPSVVKTYYSHISKDVYSIKTNCTNSVVETVENKKDDKFTTNITSEYMVDGVFCSFNCCLAFINDNKKNPLYNLSTTLLLKICKECNPNKKITKIIPAGSWRLLQEYGGYLTISEFRKSFDTVEYEYNGLINFVPIGHIYEEKISIS